MRLSFISAVLGLSFLVSTAAWAQSPHLSKTRAQELFQEIWELVESRFYDPELHGIDKEKTLSEYLAKIEAEPDQFLALTNASLGTLRASHTRLYHESDPLYYQLLDVFAYGPKGPEIRQLFDGDLPRYEGILAVTSEGLVTGVVPGGPADKAGLRVGDQIQSADGADFHPIESFRAKSGRNVCLDIKRGERVLTLVVTPETIQPREAFLRSLADSAEVIEQPPYRLAYVRMWSYAGEAYQRELSRLLSGSLKNTDALLLDLRGSWGGASPDFVKLFAPGVELALRPRDGEVFQQKEEAYTAPIMILCDETVSSGKEILAYSLQRSGRAKLVGSQSRGAVLGGALHLLPGGYALYLAEADVAVDGRRLEGMGVSPDHYFPSEFHLEDGGDALVFQGKNWLLQELIRRELKHRWFVDQQARIDGVHVREVDRQNQAWLKVLLAHHGWPSREWYDEAAQTAWLIAQHADNDLEFQKKALELLTQAVEDGQAPPKEQAYLQDRVLVNQGLPQIYGTQVMRENGKLVPREVVEPERLNERRRSVGLPTIEEYLKSFESF